MEPEPFPMSAAETAVWQDLVGRRCGLTFSESRMRLLRQGVHARMQCRGLASATEYYHHLVFHPDGSREWPELLDLLLNKETSFFRHQASFDVLTGQVLPRLAAAGGAEPLQMWSAGCSTGQEAYSLALAARLTPELHEQPVRVVGSDLSAKALQRARQGRYRPFEARQLPDALRALYFATVEDDGRPALQAVPELRAAVEFQPCNLLDPATYPAGGQAVIFCQNVLIYFPPAVRAVIVRQLAETLRPDGCLFLAPGEAVGIPLPGLESLRLRDVSVFQRSA